MTALAGSNRDFFEHGIARTHDPAKLIVIGSNVSGVNTHVSPDIDDTGTGYQVTAGKTLYLFRGDFWSSTGTIKDVLQVGSGSTIVGSPTTLPTDPKLSPYSRLVEDVAIADAEDAQSVILWTVIAATRFPFITFSADSGTIRFRLWGYEL